MTIRFSDWCLVYQTESVVSSSPTLISNVNKLGEYPGKKADIIVNINIKIKELGSNGNVSHTSCDILDATKNCFSFLPPILLILSSSCPCFLLSRSL